MLTSTNDPDSATPDRLVPLLCLIGAGALIGLSTDLAKLATDEGMSAAAFLTWTVSGAAVVLTAIGARRGRLPTLSRPVVRYLVIAAVVSVVAPQLIFFSAVPEVGAGFVALTIAFPPLYTYLGAIALKQERFDTRRAAGVSIAFGGAVLLAVLELSQPDAPVGWIALTMIGPIILAVGNLYRTRAWPAGAEPDELAPGMLIAAAAMLITIGLLPGIEISIDMGNAAGLAIIGIQIAAFAVQYKLFFILQQRGGPVYLSMLGSVAAVVGSAIAILLLDEVAPKGLVPGGVAIAIGIGLLTVGSPKPDGQETS